MTANATTQSWLRSLQRKSLGVGGAALAISLIACIVGMLSRRTGPLLLGAYLIGYLFVLGLSLGSLGLLMLQHVTGGAWGATLRRALEAATRALPVVSVLFLPVLLGAGSLYEWAHADHHDHLIAEKQAYLNIPFFAARAVFYFAVWNVLAITLNRWARQQENSTSPRLARRFRLLCGPGLALYALTMTFAAFDWAMSLTPHWYSTIYGVLMIVGQVLSALAIAIIATLLVARRQGQQDEIGRSTLADLGSLMLAFVMLWAYMSLSQLLIIWSGNLPEEISWYLPRLNGAWGMMGLMLALFHFFVPFFALLQGEFKRNPRRLMQMAVLLLAMRVVDLCWIIGASLHVAGALNLVVVMLAVVGVVGLGGVWLSVTARQLLARPLTLYPPPALDPTDADAEVAG